MNTGSQNLKSIIIFLSIIIYISAVFLLTNDSMKGTDGQFIYPLDDTYIHMSIAKNFSQYGVWGSTKYEFTSNSSSPLYTLLLALSFLIFGINDFLPLILNIILGIGVIIISYKILDFNKHNIFESFFAILFSSMIMPLHVITFSGMEHLLQLLLLLLFLYQLLLFLNNKKVNFIYLIALSFLIPMSRYEGIIIILLSSILIFRNNKRLSLLITLSAISSVIIYGIIAKINGWPFIPVSIILKSSKLDSVFDYFNPIIIANNFLESLHFIEPFNLFLFLAGSAFVVLFGYYRFIIKKEYLNFISILFLAAIANIIFNRQIQLYRYDAYLYFIISILVLPILFSIAKIFNFKKIFDSVFLIKIFYLIIILLLFIYSPFNRFIISYDKAKTASMNIYHQQIQMSNFINKYYNNKTIAANDIGAICYFNDIKLFDVWGLANKYIVEYKSSNNYNTKTFKQLFNEAKVDLAIIYDEWLIEGIGKIPKDWNKKATWTIQNNVVCAFPTVSFYEFKNDKLLNNLLDNSKYLNKNVKQNFYY